MLDTAASRHGLATIPDAEGTNTEACSPFSDADRAAADDAAVPKPRPAADTIPDAEGADTGACLPFPAADGAAADTFLADEAEDTVDTLLDLFQKNDEIAHQARRGSARRASVLLTAMIEAEAVEPELSSYSSVIMAQAKGYDGSARTAMDVLAKLLASEDASVQCSTVIVNAVLNAHAKCDDGSAAAALGLLRRMRAGLRLDSISYNTAINCFAKCKDGSAEGAMGVYREMLAEGVAPTSVTYYSLLSAQRSQKDGTSANAIRALDDVVAKLGQSPDETMLTTAIALQPRVEDGSGRVALALLGRMKQAGMCITAKLLNCVIDAQAKSEDGSARVALALLDSMRQSRLAEVRPSVVTYTSAIDCQAKCRDGDGRTAVALLEEMVAEGLAANHVTYLCCMNAQARRGSAKVAVALLQRLRQQGIAATHSMFNSAISACANCADGSAAAALRVLGQMDAAGAVPSALSYSMCVEAQCAHDDGTAFHAYELIGRMLKAGLRVDGLTFNHAINAQSKKEDGTARAAVALFQAMFGLMEPNLYSYNIVLNACATQRPAQLGAAASVLDKMLSKGFAPNEYTMSALLRCAAFADRPDPAAARRWFAEFCCCDGFEVNDHIARALRAALGDEADDLLARAGAPSRRVVVRRKSGSPTLDRRSIRSRNSQSSDWRGTPARKSSWRQASPDSPPAAPARMRSRSPTTWERGGFDSPPPTPRTPRTPRTPSKDGVFDFPAGPSKPKSRSMSAPFISSGLGLGALPPRTSLVDKIRSIKESAQKQKSSALLSPDFFGGAGSGSGSGSTPSSPLLSPRDLSGGSGSTFPAAAAPPPGLGRRSSASAGLGSVFEAGVGGVLAPVEPKKMLQRRRSTRSSLRAVEGVVREPSGPDGTRGFGRRRSSQLAAGAALGLGASVAVGVIG